MDWNRAGRATALVKSSSDERMTSRVASIALVRSDLITVCLISSTRRDRVCHRLYEMPGWNV